MKKKYNTMSYIVIKWKTHITLPENTLAPCIKMSHIKILITS